MSPLEAKQIVRQALESNDLDAIVSLVRQQKRTLSLLIRIAYDKDTLAGWRAIKAVGFAAKALLQKDQEYLRMTIRKLLWSLTDESGGIGWAAPEILGEIVSADPGQFSDIIPLIAEVYSVEEDVFRPGVVYALSRIAETAPERVAGYENIIMMSLIDKNPLVKVNALELIGRLWAISREKKLWQDEYFEKLKRTIKMLTNNIKVVWIYNNDCFIDTQVGEKALYILNKMDMS